jgi:hypothetical protein
MSGIEPLYDSQGHIRRRFADGYLVSREANICLVNEHEDKITGYIIAKITAAPPVYDPGSLVCVIDDFAVASSGLWDTVGSGLLQEARRLARLRGADLTVVVCAQMDAPKREMLATEGLYVASEWYVSP